MELTVNIEDKEYQLPKKTLKLAKMIDAAYAALSSEDSYKRQYAFVKEILGADETNKLLNGDNINNIDLVLLSVSFKKIEKAYVKPVEDVEVESLDSSIDDKIDKLVAVGEAVDKVAKAGKR